MQGEFTAWILPYSVLSHDILGGDDSPSSSTSAGDASLDSKSTARTCLSVKRAASGREDSAPTPRMTRQLLFRRREKDRLDVENSGRRSLPGVIARTQPPTDEFVTPVRQTVVKRASRPNSPMTLTNNVSSGGVLRRMAVPARSRIASIRRESDCSEQGNRDSEAAHERLVKASQQVSLGFEDFCLDERSHYFTPCHILYSKEIL